MCFWLNILYVWVWMHAGMSMCFWLNMGLCLLLPAVSTRAPAGPTVTSLLGEGGGEPTFRLLVGDKVTVPTPAGVCYLTGCCCGQGTVCCVGEFQSIQFIAN